MDFVSASFLNLEPDRGQNQADGHFPLGGVMGRCSAGAQEGGWRLLLQTCFFSRGLLQDLLVCSHCCCVGSSLLPPLAETRPPRPTPVFLSTHFPEGIIHTPWALILRSPPEPHAGRCLCSPR